MKRKQGLRRGDTVMVISGGNSVKRPIRGKKGKILRFVGSDRVVVEGLNFVARHVRPSGAQKPSGKVVKEAPIHVARVMYYVEKIQKPVRIRHRVLADGKKVRGYLDPSSKEFVQLDA